MTNASTQKKFDLHERVTEQIVAQLEHGTPPWELPWNRSAMIPRNSSSDRAYNGVNVLLLWASTLANEYTSSRWMTYRQAQELDGQVRKGESSTLVTFWKILKVKDEEEDDEEKTIPLLRYYRVFNVDQIDGIDPEVQQDTDLRSEELDAFFARIPAKLRHGSDRAGYSPAADDIVMPPFEQFASPRAYYATLAHELMHWTGHPSRLDRDLTGRFGDEAYAMEELVAELGAAFLCAELGLGYDTQHASYLAHWGEILGADKYAIFTAAKQATAAVDHLHTDLA